ncbi:MAG: bifunctional serine/threonine-protein kinase/formylglycine-generating enzyme family protein [Planctomycetota bacterium]
MSVEREREVLRLLKHALELPDEERRAWLERECGNDRALGARVLELLGSRPPSSFLQPRELPLGAPTAHLPDPLSAGAKLGDYEVLELVDQGGMGAVYVAQQLGVQRLVALKVVQAHLLDDAALRRFRDEAEILGRLEHPGIVRIYDAGECLQAERTVPFLAMEYVRGGVPITRHAEARGLDVRARVQLFVRVCEALAYAHANGVVHRDLKPSNLLVGEDGVPKVIDFGIGAINELDRTRLTGTGFALGTPLYMAPERVLSGEDGREPASDVYSLGVVLYELLAGERPFDWPTPHQALRSLSTIPERPSRRVRGVPAQLDWVVLRAMAFEPGRRHPSVAALAESLSRFLADQPIGDAPPSLTYRARCFVRRHRTRLQVGTLLAITLALALGFALYRSWTRDELEAVRTEEELRDLLEERAALHPASGREAQLRRWAERASELTSRAEGLRRAAAQAPSAEAADLERLIDELLLLDAWRRRSEEGWSDWTSAFGERSTDAPEAAARWAEFQRSVEEGECPTYAGLAIAPQAGLVPLRRNPSSELWEFAFLPSGDAPQGARRTEDAIVFVLLPPGSVTVGASADSTQARDLEMPRNEVAIGRPFFCSKYELTDAQWERMAGYRPSGGTMLPPSVASLKREEVRVVLAAFGLDLPTEAQWEYAARAGSELEQPVSDERPRDAGVANDPHEVKRVSLASDGAPNAFGLHDLLGGLGEWCREEFLVAYGATESLDPNDGYRGGPAAGGDDFWSIRGYVVGVPSLHVATYQRSAADARDRRDPITGVRPIRVVEP